MATYRNGQEVIITDWQGIEHRAIARSDIEGVQDRHGRRVHDFHVVWIELTDHREGVWLAPWPADAVRPASEENP